MTETAKQNGLEPFEYPAHVIEELSKATTLDQLEAPLSGNVAPE